MDKKTIWTIGKTQGRPVLIWDCKKICEDHFDNIEMSGLFSSFIVKYGINKGKAFYERHIVFPMLRTFPNDTHSSYQFDVNIDALPSILVNGIPMRENAVNFKLNGTVECNSAFIADCVNLKIKRNIFPSTDKQAVCEIITIRNIGSDQVNLSLDKETDRKLDSTLGPMGVVSAMLHAYIVKGKERVKSIVIEAGKSASVAIVYSGKLAFAEDVGITLDLQNEYRKRIKRIKELMGAVVLDTGSELFDTMFAFAKVRAGESIFRTMRGDIHSPGGRAYYAAVWCNDQVEYAGPWQAYTGDKLQTDAGYNAYAWYYPFMDDTFDNPIPSSIIAEGTNIWNGAGDRGDAAMYLYGASRYALTCGNMGKNNELWRAIKWCALYCMSRKNESGVIASDADELEHRLPSGKANLSTSMLALGGLRYSARIADALKERENAETFRREADELEIASDRYFAANIRGFDTYRYYEGNTTLRSWICMPLCVDVNRHVDGTVAAITSPYLMSDAGQLSEEGTDVAWDRSTLYGVRGMFRCGKRDEAWAYMQEYCTKRLIGAHVPYAVEAYPEGDMRHLSAESALFCQIVTEGMLAIDPLSFKSFSFVPCLAKGMDRLIISNIHAFGEIFDIRVDNDSWSLDTKSGKHFSSTSHERQVIEF